MLHPWSYSLIPARFSGDVVRLSLLSLLTPSPAERAGGLRPEVSGERDGTGRVSPSEMK